MVYEVVFADLTFLSLTYMWSPPIITHLSSSLFLSLLDLADLLFFNPTSPTPSDGAGQP